MELEWKEALHLARYRHGDMLDRELAEELQIHVKQLWRWFGGHQWPGEASQKVIHSYCGAAGIIPLFGVEKNGR